MRKTKLHSWKRSSCYVFFIYINEVCSHKFASFCFICRFHDMTQFIHVKYFLRIPLFWRYHQRKSVKVFWTSLLFQLRYCTNSKFLVSWRRIIIKTGAPTDTLTLFLLDILLVCLRKIKDLKAMEQSTDVCRYESQHSLRLIIISQLHAITMGLQLFIQGAFYCHMSLKKGNDVCLWNNYVVVHNLFNILEFQSPRYCFCKFMICRIIQNHYRVVF